MQLLEGIELKSALAWADKKQLSDLDYRFLNASQKLVQKTTESELLNNKVPSQAISDRIVLIGTISPTLGNLYLTPYSRWHKRIPPRSAPVTIHANIISQLLSSAIDGRPMLKVRSEPLELSWVVIWALIGAFSSWLMYFVSAKLLTNLMATLILISITYLAFLKGWWLPIVPTLIALGLSSILITIVSDQKSEKLQEQKVIEYLEKYSKINSLVAQVAIEYFKKSKF